MWLETHTGRSETFRPEFIKLYSKLTHNGQKMTPQVRGPASKSEDLSSIPRTHKKVERKNKFPQVVLL